MIKRFITGGEDIPEDMEVALGECKIEYWQNPDCTEDRDGDGQVIILTTRNNGVADFLHFETKGWSIDDVGELVQIVEDFKKRVGYDAKRSKREDSIETSGDS